MNTPTILKFGGTSMGDERSWQQVMDIMGKYQHPVVVVSATARTTRKLIKAAETAAGHLKEARKISREIERSHRQLVENVTESAGESDESTVKNECLNHLREKIKELNTGLEYISGKGAVSHAQKDALASIGEQLSSFLFARCCTLFGHPTQWVDARSIIKTDATYGNANPDFSQIKSSSAKLQELVEEGSIPVLGGYYGQDAEGNITTLGFEGSDYTASLIGSALDAQSIEIWTDVSGIYTCDPRHVEQAQPIKEMSFREATEMAYFGAKVLHPSTLKPAARKSIPVFVKNIFEAGQPGTKIHGQSSHADTVRAITFLHNIVILSVTSPATIMGYNFLSSVFETLERRRLTVDVVTTTEASVSIAVEEPDGLDLLVSELQKIGEVSMMKNQGLISLIGCNITDPRSVSERILEKVTAGEISMLSSSKAKKNLTLVMDQDRLLESVKAIHHSLFG